MIQDETLSHPIPAEYHYLTHPFYLIRVIESVKIQYACGSVRNLKFIVDFHHECDDIFVRTASSFNYLEVQSDRHHILDLFLYVGGSWGSKAAMVFIDHLCCLPYAAVVVYISCSVRRLSLGTPLSLLEILGSSLSIFSSLLICSHRCL